MSTESASVWYTVPEAFKANRSKIRTAEETRGKLIYLPRQKEAMKEARGSFNFNVKNSSSGSPKCDYEAQLRAGKHSDQLHLKITLRNLPFRDPFYEMDTPLVISLNGDPNRNIERVQMALKDAIESILSTRSSVELAALERNRGFREKMRDLDIPLPQEAGEKTLDSHTGEITLRETASAILRELKA